MVITERVGRQGNVIKLTLAEGVSISSATPHLVQAFGTCLQNKNYNMILDMKGINYPPSSFIALLIEVSAQVRRAGGDLKLINVSHSARNNLVTFSPLTYLSVDSDEVSALEEFEKSGLLSEEPLTSEETLPSEETTAEFHITEKLPVEMPRQETLPEDPIRDEFKIKTEGYRLQVKSQVDSLYNICDFVTNLAEKAGMNEKELGKIKVTVYEACLNVIEHAYHSDPDEWMVVMVHYDTERFIIIIQDWGESFNFDDTRPYDVQQAMRDRKTGGFGLYIIKRSMDEVKYRTDPVHGNRLLLVKYLKEDLKG